MASSFLYPEDIDEGTAMMDARGPTGRTPQVSNRTFKDAGNTVSPLNLK